MCEPSFNTDCLVKAMYNLKSEGDMYPSDLSVFNLLGKWMTKRHIIQCEARIKEANMTGVISDEMVRQGNLTRAHLSTGLSKVSSEPHCVCVHVCACVGKGHSEEKVQRDKCRLSLHGAQCRTNMLE
jgi:hypothetical protein